MFWKRLFHNAAAKMLFGETEYDMLDRWIEQQKARVLEICSRRQDDPNSKGVVHSHTIGYDTSFLTKRQMAILGKKIESIHDVCQQYDIALQISGFRSPAEAWKIRSQHNSIPKWRHVSINLLDVETSLPGENPIEPSVSINAVSWEPYNPYEHPRYLREHPRKTMAPL